MSDRFPCPFCSGTFEFIGAEGAEEAIVHSAPWCKQITEMDALEYLEAVNNENARREGPDAVARLAEQRKEDEN